jgi:hypothetical protein
MDEPPVKTIWKNKGGIKATTAEKEKLKVYVFGTVVRLNKMAGHIAKRIQQP